MDCNETLPEEDESQSVMDSSLIHDETMEQVKKMCLVLMCYADHL
jgi:hypothetical protein